MTNTITDEISRIRSAFDALMSHINPSTAVSNGQNRNNDEESLISNERIPEMPGGLPILNQESEPPTQVNENLMNKSSKILTYLFAAFLFIIVIPVYLIYRFLIFVLFIILSIYIKFQKRGYHSINNRINSPANTARRFITNFDDRIGNSIEENHIERPDFMECGYSQALYIFKQKITWLLVYIEGDSDSIETVKFTQDVLTDDRFLSYINQKNFLIWGGSISDSDAFQIANQFNITKLPFLGLLSLTVNQVPTSSGMQQSAPVISLVSKIQGYKKLNTVLHKFDRAFQKYNPMLENLRTELTPVFRTVEDDALTNSIRRNQQQISDNRQLEKQWLQWRKSKIQPVSPDSEQNVSIAIRFPDMSRKIIKVNKDCSLEEVYAIVACNLIENIEIDNESYDDYEEPLNFNYRYKFDLSTVLPCEVLQPSTELLIRDNSLICPTGNLIISMHTEDGDRNNI